MPAATPPEPPVPTHPPTPPRGTDAAPALRVAAALAVPARDVPAAARAAEARGMERLCMSENRYDPFLQLARAADATTTAELATGVAVAFARTPMTLAYEAWGLHEASGGRAVIGLGSQVEAHVVRRFGMEWSRPAARMAEYVRAVRAIWDSWQTGARLDFQGEFYRHTLMIPRFAPPPLPAPPPILLAGVGPRMTAVAGAVADGFLAHAFVTPDYLRDVTLPLLTEARAGTAAAGAPWTARPFEVTGHVLAAVGDTDEQIERLRTGVRDRIAFYASTPDYRPVLEHHGWGGLQPELHRLSKAGRWTELGALIDDEVFDAFAVAGDPGSVAREVAARYGGLVDRVCLTGGVDQPDELLVAAAVRISGA